jgi:hypothetical protein
MPCKICGSALHYHTAGLTCRNCGFSIDHQFLSEAICQSCNNILDESEKTTGICIHRMYDIVKPAAATEISSAESQNIYSNVKEFREHQQYVDDTGITEVLHGADSAVGRGVQFMKNVKKKMDICFDSKAPSIVVEIDAYRNGYEDIRSRGGKIRAFTEITRDNLHYCKELMKLVDELRHLEEMKGGITVSETEYMATTVLQEAMPLTQVIYSNTMEVVEKMQYMFDIFWYRATPADQKIREIEEGLEHVETKVLENPEVKLNHMR